MPPRRKAPPGRVSAAPAAGGPDRIGALPDEVLGLVLLLLPVHQAVRTCMLARRWRHLWRAVPGLRFTRVREWDNPRRSGGVYRFIPFVDRLFTLRHGGSAPLEYCHIDFDFPDIDFYADIERHVDRWIQQAVRCRARVLLLGTSLSHMAELPNMPLISRHLTRLELENVCGNCDFLDLSGCPSLVDLKMVRSCIDAEKMSSPYVKKLSLICCEFYPDDRNQLCFLSLVSLELHYSFGRAPFLQSMPSLVAAIIRFFVDCADRCDKSVFGDCDDDYCRGCRNFFDSSADHLTNGMCLEGLSEATRLELSADPAMYVFRRDLKCCPTFAKLKTLLLNEWYVVADLSELICFLQHSPILEKLTIQL